MQFGFFSFAGRRKWIALAAILIFLIAGLGLASWQVAASNSAEVSGLLWPDSDSPQNVIPRQPAPPPERVSFLTGESHLASEYSKLPIAVMIENTPQSRPQLAGLASAGVVYETLAEGGVTRFLAIFDRADSLTKVGPVRSARPYFVDWAAEYGGAYLHAGGSPEALAEIPNRPLVDFTEGATGYFRDRAFPAPHNLFSDLTKVAAELAKSSRIPVLAGARFRFADSAWANAERVDAIQVDFSDAMFRARFEFDPAAGNYARKLWGAIHSQADGTEIRPKNVIVQFTDYLPVDAKGRLELRTTGTGEAWFFSGGRYQIGRWEKLATDSQTRFLAADGSVLALPPGQTWIAAVDAAYKVTLTRPPAPTKSPVIQP